MKNKISITKILNVAKNEYVKWIYNPRMILFLVLYVFLYDYIIEEMLEASEKMDSMIMVFEPFIAMANSELLIMVIPAVFIVLMSDFPKTDGNTMFYISRVGKTNWLVGQVLFGISSAVSYLAAILGVSIVMSAERGYAKNLWSPVVTQYTKMFPNEIRSRIPMLINSRMYNNLTPARALFLTLGMVFFMLLIIELLQMVGFCIGKRMMGILVSYMIIGVGSSLCALNHKSMWIFPSAHSIAWLHFDPVLKIQNVSIWTSFIYFLLVAAVMFIISVITMRHYDFSKVTDMED